MHAPGPLSLELNRALVRLQLSLKTELGVMDAEDFHNPRTLAHADEFVRQTQEEMRALIRRGDRPTPLATH